MMRRVLLIILLTINIFTLSGCWDQLDIGNLAIITGIGVEAGSEESIRIIVQAINTRAVSVSSSGGGLAFQKPYRNKVVEGDSLYDAFSNLYLITSTQHSFSHVGVIIVSEDLARERGIREILDFLERNGQFRLDPWLIIGRGNIVNLMDVEGGIKTIPTQVMEEAIKVQNGNNTFAPLQIGQFMRLMQNETTQPYTAGFQSIPNNSIPDEAGHATVNGHVPEPLHDIALNGTAVFRQDKLVGWLDKRESSGLRWLRGEVKQGHIIFDDPEEPNKKVGTQILNAKTKLKSELQNGQISIKVSIAVESSLQEVQGKNNLGKTSVISKLEAAQEKQVKAEIMAVLQKAQQQYKVDVFGFGEAVHRSYPNDWKSIEPEWSKIFPEVQVDIQVKSKISHTSIIGKPAEPGQR